MAAIASYTLAQAGVFCYNNSMTPEQADMEINERALPVFHNFRYRESQHPFYRVGRDDLYSEFTDHPTGPRHLAHMSGGRGSGHLTGQYGFGSPVHGAERVSGPVNPFMITAGPRWSDGDPAGKFAKNARTVLRLAEHIVGEHDWSDQLHRARVINTYKETGPSFEYRGRTYYVDLFFPVMDLNRHQNTGPRITEEELWDAVLAWTEYQQVHPMNILLSRKGYDGIMWGQYTREFGDTFDWGSLKFPPITHMGQVVGLVPFGKRRILPQTASARRNPDRDLRSLERAWGAQGSEDAFDAYASALYRAGQLWNSDLPRNRLYLWMVGQPQFRDDIVGIARYLRRSTPEELHLERPHPYAGHRGVEMHMLIAVGRSFHTGYTPGNTGVHLVLQDPNTKIVEITGMRRPEITAWVAQLEREGLPNGWKLQTDASTSHRRNPDAQTELEWLEDDYWGQPRYLQRKDLVKINQLREQLGMPQVEADLQPIATTAPSREEEVGLPQPSQPETSKPKRDYPVARFLYQQYLDLISVLRPLQEYANQVILNTRPNNSGQTPVWALATLGRDGGELVCDVCERGIPLEGGPHSNQTAGRAWATASDKLRNQSWYNYILGGVMFVQEVNNTLRVYHGYPNHSCHRTAERNDALARKEFNSNRPERPPKMRAELHAYLTDVIGISDVEDRDRVIRELDDVLFNYDPGLGINRP